MFIDRICRKLGVLVIQKFISLDSLTTKSNEQLVIQLLDGYSI